MTQDLKVKVCGQSDIDKFLSKRDGETKVGQVVHLLDQALSKKNIEDALSDVSKKGASYAIVMIPEDIGPRANLGRGGAHKAPMTFMSYFLNMQANQYFDYKKAVLVGEIEVEDLMEKSSKADTKTLRELCVQLDERVAPVVQAIVKSGMEPIVIGGGNNNSLPVIQGVVEALRTVDSTIGMAVVNCDPHADFRRLEGRHSGNPFSYANDRGYLKRYCVFGMHENYNNEDMLDRLAKNHFPTFSYEDFAVRGECSFTESVKRMCAYLADGGHPVGCELDVDGIINMPASARTPFGISQEQAAAFIHQVASRLDSYYLHLSEAAPEWSSDEGDKQTGKGLALLVVTYLKAREEYRKEHSDQVGVQQLLKAQKVSSR